MNRTHWRQANRWLRLRWYFEGMLRRALDRGNLEAAQHLVGLRQDVESRRRREVAILRARRGENRNENRP
jgi:hypothetical protein